MKIRIFYLLVIKVVPVIIIILLAVNLIVFAVGASEDIIIEYKLDKYNYESRLKAYEASTSIINSNKLSDYNGQYLLFPMVVPDDLVPIITSRPGAVGDAPTHTDVHPHAGTDLGYLDPRPNNTEIISATSGTVTKSGLYGARGYTVEVTDIKGYSFIYQHLVKGSITLEIGDKVEPGDHIGYMGGSNGSGPPYAKHLHFEVRKGSSIIDAFAEYDFKVKGDTFILYDSTGQGYPDVIIKGEK